MDLRMGARRFELILMYFYILNYMYATPTQKNLKIEWINVL